MRDLFNGLFHHHGNHSTDTYVGGGVSSRVNYFITLTTTHRYIMGGGVSFYSHVGCLLECCVTMAQTHVGGGGGWGI